MLKRAIKYCKDTIKDDYSPKYVKLQCCELLPILLDEDPKYFVNTSKLTKIKSLLSIIKMPTGSKTGESVVTALAGFQIFFLVSVLCIYHRDDTTKRRFENVLLELPRKSGKTMLVALIFIISLLLEPKYSRLFSVAPDGALSREVYTLIKQFIGVSPLLQQINKKDIFKINRDKLLCILTENEYIPLNYSTSRMDGKMPSIWLCDETSALPDSYPISAMRLGSLPVKNKLGIMISTKYTKVDTPFEDEIEFHKQRLDGTLQDDTAFALLYEPDKDLIDQWATSDKIIKQVNPLSVELKSVFDEVEKMRTQAIAVKGQQSQFKCKMLNIIAQAETETFVDINDLKECRIDDFDWSGRDVYIGLDLSMTADNTGVVMVTRDEYGHLVSHPMCFIPTDNIDKKTKFEKCDYRRYIDLGLCIDCGTNVIDYGKVENYIIDTLQQEFDVNILSVGYDRYNAISTVNKLEENGIDCVEIRQHSSVLHPATKLLYEEISTHNFRYVTNPLYEINFANAVCTYDMNMNRYVAKKKSNGKVDLVVATINAVCLLQQNEILDEQWTCCY